MTVGATGVLVSAAVAAGYLAALHRLHARGERWPVARTVSAAVGLLVILGLTCGWVETHAERLLWVNAAQLLGLLAVAPLLLALGSPVTLACRAAPTRVGLPIRRLLALRVLRPFTYPVVGALLIAAIPLAVYFTRFAATVAGAPVLHQLFLLVLLVVGFLVAYPLGEGDLKPSTFSYPVAMFAAFIELIIDAGPGIVLRYRSALIEGGFWAPRERAAGFDPLNDQHHAGALLWFVGEAWDLPVLAVLFVGWMRADRRHAEEIDAALDATGHDADGMTRPWWLPAPK